jgi:arylsulfatase A-like enzyme
MPKDLEPILARQMEIYAGFLEHTDHYVGRLADALKDLGVLGDTLVIYIMGDNGASAEGTLNGSFNEMAKGNGWVAICPKDWRPRLKYPPLRRSFSTQATAGRCGASHH